MLQIMDDGILTDSQGRHVDFKNTIIVMTSNIGARNITDKRTSLGFSAKESVEDDERDNEEIRELVMKDLKNTFRPEFINRIDETVVFHRLTREDIRKIAANMLQTVSDRLSTLDIKLEVSEEAVDKLAEVGYDPTYGARPLRRTIQSLIEDAAAEKLLDGSIKAGERVKATVENDKIVLEAA